MKFQTTLGEILHHADWDKFCALKDLNPWILNEGIANSSDKVTLSLEECAKIGLAIQ